jgi:hypothetical protein
MSPFDDLEPFTAFLVLLANGAFAVGFIIMDPEMGPLVHRQVYTVKKDAEQALAEIEADLYDRPLAPAHPTSDHTIIYTCLGK